VSVTVRRARPGDALAVRKLLKELGYSHDPRATDETVSQVVKHPEAAVFVACEGVEVLGYAALSIRPQMRLAGLLASLDELVVTQSRRGSGLGTMLLDAAIAHAKALQCRRIEVLQTRRRESYDRKFYQERRFVEVDSAVLRIDL
jgi:N-acetylglutamate synthase-like GNAT family acetyltransferase